MRTSRNSVYPAYKLDDAEDASTNDATDNDGNPNPTIRNETRIDEIEIKYILYPFSQSVGFKCFIIFNI